MESGVKVPNQELHRVVITAILFRHDQRMLITRRAMDKMQWPGLWTVPGGAMETDDYSHRLTDDHNIQYGVLETALRREVLEEVGLAITRPWLVEDMAFIRKDGMPVLCLSMAARVHTTNVILNDESIDFAWVNVQEAKNYPLIEGIQGELEAAERSKGQRYTG